MKAKYNFLRESLPKDSVPVIFDETEIIKKVTGRVYQSKQFTCRKCGITFEVYSDSAISRQELCEDCKLKLKEI